MTAPPNAEQLQKLAALVSRLCSRAALGKPAQQYFYEIGDGFGTQVELTTRRGGRSIQGRIRSGRGGSHFELTLSEHQITFRHPCAGAAGELWAPRSAPASGLSSAPSTGSVSDIRVAFEVAEIARRLQHISVLRRVMAGIRERRDTVPQLALAS